MCVCVCAYIDTQQAYTRFFFFFLIVDKRNRREMSLCSYCAFLCTCTCIVCLRFSNYREKHEISVYARASDDDDDDDGILHGLPAYLSGLVCVYGHGTKTRFDNKR